MESLYNTLNIEKESSPEEIRKQYKLLANKYHPDNKSDGDNEKFKEINHAYEVLSDPEKRKVYDLYGEDKLNNDKYSYHEEESKDSIRKVKKCKDKTHFIHISLEQVLNGDSIEFEYTKKTICMECQGTGSDNPAARRKCGGCQGKGEKIILQRMGIMIIQNIVECEECEGIGWEKNEYICEVCNGEKVNYQSNKINIKIEKGCPEGYRYVFSGQGDQAPKAINGDLIVEVFIKKHDLYIREGGDLWISIDLTLLEALLGYKRYIPILGSNEKLKIESELNTQHGEIKTILNYGLPLYKNPLRKGNLHIKFNVILPINLSKEMVSKVESVLSERSNPISKKENLKKDVYSLSDFKSDQMNTNVCGGKYEKVEYKNQYDIDDENENESESENYSKDFYGFHQKVNCQYQ